MTESRAPEAPEPVQRGRDTVRMASGDGSEDVRISTKHGPDNHGGSRPCLNCGADVPRPRRRGQQKDFCSDRCRGAYHLAKRRDELSEAVRRLEEVDAELVRLHALVQGTIGSVKATIGTPRK